MRFDVISIFPTMFDGLRASQIFRRAEESGKIELHVHDLRDFAEDKHKTVDDVPFGGGPGMVLKVDPLVRAVESLPTLEGRKVFLTSPQGRKLTQGWVEEIAMLSQVVVVAGRYEGVDERFVEGWVDEEFSIGDYVLAGGEIPAMALVEAAARLIPGVVGDWESVQTDSFTSGGLKHPQYTRPAEFRGMEVPSVLRSGNHGEIEKWRASESLRRTADLRPELLKKKIEEVARTVDKPTA